MQSEYRDINGKKSKTAVMDCILWSTWSSSCSNDDGSSTRSEISQFVTTKGEIHIMLQIVNCTLCYDGG